MAPDVKILMGSRPGPDAAKKVSKAFDRMGASGGAPVAHFTPSVRIGGT